MDDSQLVLFANFDSANMARYERVYKSNATINGASNGTSAQTNAVGNSTTNATNGTNKNNSNSGDC